MGVEVSSVFVACGLVATVSGGSSVHEPANTTTSVVAKPGGGQSL